MKGRAGLALVCVVLSACGVRGQDVPERLPPGVVPSELRPSAASDLGGRNRTVPKPASTDVRKWARDHGLTTAERGRLPKTVLEAYAAAHSGDRTGATPGQGGSQRAAPAAKADTADVPARRTRTPGPRAGKAATRTRNAGDAESSSVTSRHRAPPAARTTPPAHDLEERLTAVETQLVIALARLESLEGKMTKSLLGLRVTL